MDPLVLFVLHALLMLNLDSYLMNVHDVLLCIFCSMALKYL